MGSWIGHIDEAIFFLCISLWWCYNIFSNYIDVGGDVHRYKPQMSYSTKLRKREIPLEIVFKIIFPVCGFLGELLSHGTPFHDSDGNLTRLNNIQHMPIYGGFILHGLIDLAEFYRFPVIKGSNYMSGALAFFWYGYGFYFHATAHAGKEPLENMMHLLSIPLMFITCTAGIIEFWQGQGNIWPQLVRAWSVLNLGTWYIQVSFVLFKPVGGDHNPDWDQNDHRNVMAVVAILGTHLILNFLFMCLLYAFIFTIKRHFCKLPRHSIQYTHLTNNVIIEDKDEMQSCLLNETDEI